ncbi:trypsin-like peptidase domain-containing protein [Tenacibaculum maritimum]|uniref:Serine protease n=1 Tax=Tenacibaculum maritimum NCIMB 2154 TaxID=1349785 RepID=A0A2H1EB91_9FLAO|nr:trypsin-like peptidase domain-containing protein [Tenacibaculum maritimum]MCD9561798.1 trypsin-like peptidase domain-containing protein [Tenacibaculum maritimum]MCD9565234.1 trypsin-like peptidase domain-containing protein [Tenacibaculum maritimum]MCD9578634.1 trypsin-like peptidase domain-containing protein [Tenacibaculum maritimum]MCD9581026.1 trypsin-like peptidase domain-containing protein [Tenacibaculum maritimum]MCD9596478.1 trypsin-like peptidase domain-containing protein [Tenacibacu
MKKFIGILGAAFLGGVISLAGYKFLIEKPVFVEQAQKPTLQTVKTNYNPIVVNNSSSPTDFTEAAERTVHAVVHVKNTALKTQINPWAEYFYGRGSGQKKYEQVGTGSGVIISSDGYIITNNHVIDGANDIEITLNSRKKVKAKLIGADAKNDIALLKVDTDMELPYIPFGNSDNVKIGEWVLAVGNPYNLTSTVTAGIVSAKGRDLEGNTNIDSFIQTDAAVNPGNSGGALVNTRGELMGINTAISSKTGSFIGYSFAVPSNIAKKIIDDLLEYGDVQEALIGFTPDLRNSEEIEGVKVGAITEDSGAEKAGLEEGDVITKVNDNRITKFSDLKGQLSAKRPGEEVTLTVLREGNKLEKLVVLSKKDFVEIRELGLVLKDLSKKEIKKYKVKGGAKVLQNANRYLMAYGVEAGYIITKINKEDVIDGLDAKRRLTSAARSNAPLFIEVINLKGERERYGFRQ